MNYIYCECGGRTVQGSSIVKFCAHCGSPFVKTNSVAAQTPALTTKAQKKKRPILPPEPEYDEDDELDDDDIEDTEDDDEEEARTVPDIDLTNNPLSIEVNGPRKINVNDLAGTREKIVPVDKINVREQTKKKESKKDFIKNLQKEGGTLRKKS